MLEAIRRLLRRRHQHEWRNTRTNPFWIATEQRCDCGAARHLLEPEDVLPIDAPPKWRHGPHPDAIA